MNVQLSNLCESCIHFDFIHGECKKGNYLNENMFTVDCDKYEKHKITQEMVKHVLV